MVKEGYKQTEAGLIPEDWDTIPFSECFDTLPNNTLSRAELNYNGGKIKNIHYGDVLIKYPSVLDCEKETLPFVNPESVAKVGTVVLKNGDIVIADTAEDETVGKMTEIIGVGEQRIVSGLHTIPCRPKQKDMFASKWLGYFMNHSSYHDQLLPFVTGIKVSSVSKSAIANTVIVVPKKEEQEQIVVALSDIDDLILNLEKLVKKKKAMREGAVQSLITGCKRLPGFTGEWEEINLSKKSKIKARIGWQGLKKAEYLDSGYSFLITGTDFVDGYIDWHGCHFVTKDRYDQDTNIQVTNGDVLLTKDGTIGKVALVDGLAKPATLNSGVFVIRPINNSYSARFLYYVLSSSVFRTFLDELAAGSTIVHLYQKDLVKFDFYIPPTIEEQEAIATVIYDMEAEIIRLQSKLEKYRKIKSGMMDELLTGKVRLV